MCTSLTIHCPAPCSLTKIPSQSVKRSAAFSAQKEDLDSNKILIIFICNGHHSFVRCICRRIWTAKRICFTKRGENCMCTKVFVFFPLFLVQLQMGGIMEILGGGDWKNVFLVKGEQVCSLPYLLYKAVFITVVISRTLHSTKRLECCRLRVISGGI